MKSNSILLLFIVAFASCSKSDMNIPAEQKIVTVAAMTDLSPGNTASFFNVDLDKTPIAPVKYGDEQRWQFTDLAIKNTVSFNYLMPLANDSFPSATYMVAVAENVGGLLTDALHYNEVSTTGVAYLGKKIDSVTVAPPGGSITLTGQTIKLTKKWYSVNFPLQYRDSTTVTGIKEVYNLLVFAPPFYTHATPGTETNTIDYTNVAVAAGYLELPGYSNAMPAIVVKQKVTNTVNYLINGTPPPDILLNAIGAQNNEVTESLSYSFYSPFYGYMGSIYMENNKVAGATFRRNF